MEAISQRNGTYAQLLFGICDGFNPFMFFGGHVDISKPFQMVGVLSNFVGRVVVVWFWAPFSSLWLIGLVFCGEYLGSRESCNLLMQSCAVLKFISWHPSRFSVAGGDGSSLECGAVMGTTK